MKKIPSYLEYFLEDILWWNNEFQARIMFWEYWIFKNWKIFAIFDGDDFYFRKNDYNQQDEQFTYKMSWKDVYLPYFKIDEIIFENKEELEKYIESSLDY